MRLKIEEKERSGVTILQLEGRVTLGDESSALRSKIKEVLAEGKTRRDKPSATSLTSTALDWARWWRDIPPARRSGANMKLANLTKRFNEQLHITKLVTVFDVYPNVEEAVKSYAIF